jgi:hypothetical protein
MDNNILNVLVDSMKSCVIQREVAYVSTTTVVLMLLYTFATHAYGQSSAPFANCISMKMEGDFVQLSMDEDCNEQQFNEAMAYYKANGYAHETSYMDFGFGKFIELDSDKFVQDKKDLGMD